ncbi:MAG: 2Fe-2S iron-sulfur cluster-binding protein [Massilia sp.]
MRHYRMSVLPGGWTVAVSSERSLLASAEEAGLIIPSSCRNGSCRTCMCQLVSGSIRHSVAWPGLSSDEKREGWILPCVAQPQSDLTLAAPAARLALPVTLA